MKKIYMKACVVAMALCVAATAMAETKTLEFDFSFPNNTGGNVGVAYEKNGKSLIINKTQKTFTALDATGTPYLFKYFQSDNAINVGYWTDALQIGSSQVILWDGQLVLAQKLTNITRVEVVARSGNGPGGTIHLGTVKSVDNNGCFQDNADMWIGREANADGSNETAVNAENTKYLTADYKTYIWQGSSAVSGHLLVKAFSRGQYYFRIKSIKIYYEDAVATAEPVTLNAIAKLSEEAPSRFFGTFSAEKDVILVAAAGVEVNTVTVKNGTMSLAPLAAADYATTSKVSNGTVNGYLVPAGTGVLVSMNESSESYKVAAAYNYDGTAEALAAENMLAPTTAGTIVATAGSKVYGFRYEDEGAQSNLGFHWGSADGTQIEEAVAGQAYLEVPEAEGAATIKGFVLGGGSISTGVESIGVDAENADAPLYDLSGRRVVNPAPGFYIKGNKKIFVK